MASSLSGKSSDNFHQSGANIADEPPPGVLKSAAFEVWNISMACWEIRAVQ